MEEDSPVSDETTETHPPAEPVWDYGADAFSAAQSHMDRVATAWDAEEGLKEVDWSFAMAPYDGCGDCDIRETLYAAEPYFYVGIAHDVLDDLAQAILLSVRNSGPEANPEALAFMAATSEMIAGVASMVLERRADLVERARQMQSIFSDFTGGPVDEPESPK